MHFPAEPFRLKTYTKKRTRNFFISHFISNESLRIFCNDARDETFIGHFMRRIRTERWVFPPYDDFSGFFFSLFPDRSARVDIFQSSKRSRTRRDETEEPRVKIAGVVKKNKRGKRTTSRKKRREEATIVARGERRGGCIMEMQLRYKSASLMRRQIFSRRKHDSIRFMPSILKNKILFFFFKLHGTVKPLSYGLIKKIIYYLNSGF